ncbi:MAG: aromatic-ring-hydroxylating dioxygenase subunit beta [Alphaproteobacteria bacterium]
MVSVERRAAIDDFLADYAHGLDDDDAEAWPDFFTAKGVYQILTKEEHDAGLPLGIFLVEGHGMMRDRVRAMRDANIFEPHHYCHVVGRARLREADDGEIAARSNFAVYRTMQDGTADLFASGKYLDRIVFEGEAPKFKQRIAVLDSRCIDVLLVMPL